MEPIKGGTLANIPTEAEELFKRYSALDSSVSWALRFAASLDNVMMVLSGMNSMDQLEENILTMNNFHSLDSEEIELCFKVAEIIKKQIAIPCTGCGYCVNGCPKHISIPDYFSIYNEDKRECLEKGWTANAFNYQLIAERGSKASECLACGQCETVCPQHLTIIKYLKDVAEHYE